MAVVTRDRLIAELEADGALELARDVDQRRCACGCKTDIKHRGERAFYVDERHRQRAYRARLQRAAEAAGVPASLSLGRIKASTSTNVRNGDAQIARNPSKARRKPAPRPGVSVYFPSPELAELALGAIEDLAGAARDDVADEHAAAADAIAKALERRRRRPT